MAHSLLSISSSYCFRLSQIHVNPQKFKPITTLYTSNCQIIHSSMVNKKRKSFSLLISNVKGQDSEQLIEDLRVPDQWLEPSKALEESEWLRTALNKWLDDEYCPEETNIEISKVAASSFYRSLLENRTDIGEILLKMAGDLESISYQESFHGAFSSANAAVSLIIQRLEQN